MTRAGLCMFFFFLVSNTNGQNFTGDWYGILDIGMQKLRIVFHIAKDSTGNYRTRSDSPDQNAFGVPIPATEIRGDSLILKVPNGNMEYKGKLIGDSVINGVFIQGLSLPLQLTKKAFEIGPPKRPQTPKPPYSYETQDIIFFNKDSSLRYGATLTYPKKGKKFPAVILITGSGQQDRDETLFEHKPFAVIADYLTKLGYAVLRIDDRGAGKTTGNFYTTGTKEYIADANTAIAYLKKNKNINSSKIGLMGHSLGGMIAPMVAAENKDVAFIISLAGVGVKGKELLIKQRQALSFKGKISASDSSIFQNYYKALDSLFEQKEQVADFVNAATEISRIAQNRIKDSALKNEIQSATQYLEIGYLQRQSAEYKSIIAYDPAPYFENLKIPFLAVNGSKDVQVDADLNLSSFKKMLTKANNKNFKLVKLEGLNHLFQQCNTCTYSEYSILEETFSPKALTVIGQWLAKNIGK